MVSLRLYGLLVGLLALWVGGWGLLMPAQVARALPWTVAPLHARFIAAMYLAGALAMGWSALSRSVAAMRIPIALACVWTGALLLISLCHLDAFDFGRSQTWFWFGAYAVYPLWGGWLWRGLRSTARPRRPDRALLALAAVCLLLAAALAFAPAAMSHAWPWAITPLLAQIYAGPFLAWTVCALMLAREAQPAARRIAIASMLVFALLALLASWLHGALFRFDGAAAWVWCVGFAAAAVLLGSRLFTADTAQA